MKSLREWIDLVEQQGTHVDVDGVSRPIHNSEGSLIAPSMETRIAFWRWFGKSKVVDQHGCPILVHRGDRIGKTTFTGRENTTNYIQGNIFFSDDRGIAKGYTPHRGNSYLSSKDMDQSHGLYSAYLKIIKPLTINAKGEDWSEVPLSGKLKKTIGWDRLQIDDLALHVQKNTSNDGLIVKDVGDQFGHGTQFVVFTNEQIKLAFS